ncbi:MAG: hypothetical protein H7222_15970 [Methylotenera sp.]|nr:hypothetical protein [Oligoflexia bacterium]
MGIQERAKKSKVNRKSAQVPLEPEKNSPIGGEIGFLKKELITLFEKERWSELSEALLTVARLGEGHAQKELCLKSQNLRQLLGSRTLVSGSSNYNQVAARFGQLMFHLSHLHWRVGSSEETAVFPKYFDLDEENMQ